MLQCGEGLAYVSTSLGSVYRKSDTDFKYRHWPITSYDSVAPRLTCSM